MPAKRLWLGIVAGAFLFVGVIGIGAISPGYSQLSQTVSELGEIGSPGRLPFTTVLLLVALTLLVFAHAVSRALLELGRSPMPAYFLVAMAISTAGVGVFAFPEPLHNIFGISETIGYQTPLIAALVCGSDVRLKRVKVFSFGMYAVVLLAILINLVALIRPPELWAQIRPIFGVVQRSLFASWFLWCAGYGILLAQAIRPRPNSVAVN